MCWFIFKSRSNVALPFGLLYEPTYFFIFITLERWHRRKLYRILHFIIIWPWNVLFLLSCLYNIGCSLTVRREEAAPFGRARVCKWRVLLPVGGNIIACWRNPWHQFLVLIGKMILLINFINCDFIDPIDWLFQLRVLYVITFHSKFRFIKIECILHSIAYHLVNSQLLSLDT